MVDPTKMPGHDVYRSQSIELSLTPPETPPHHKLLHPWPEAETIPEEAFRSKRRKLDIEPKAEVVTFDITHQEVLLLHGVKQNYVHTKQQPIPRLENDREMLVAVEVVGLNPIDWKAPYVDANRIFELD
jgi:hypothetical protein